MQWKSLFALLGLLVAGVAYAQSPVVPPHLRGVRPGSPPAAVRPVANVARAIPQPAAAQPSAVRVASNSQAIPAQFAGHHHQAGCASCGSAPAMAASSCSSCNNDAGMYAGDCCPNYIPRRALGLWNNYCACASCGHFGLGGCGSGCRMGGCCNKVPIGMYGATPYGCCLSGVGFGNCGCNSGCGMGMGCGIGCKAHGCKSFGWRWGAGGFGCEASCGCTSSASSTWGGGSAGCSNCATNGSSGAMQHTPTLANPSMMHDTYDSRETFEPEAHSPPNMPTQALPMNQLPGEAAPVAPDMAPEATPEIIPPLPPMPKSARMFPRLFQPAF